MPTKTPSALPSVSPTLFKTTREVTLDGDYDTVVGNNKALFLQECSARLSVTCRDVRPGSVIILLAGLEEDLNTAEADIQQNGLDLDSFEAMTVVVDDASSGSSAAGVIVIIVVVVIVIILGAVVYYKKIYNQPEHKFEDDRKIQVSGGGAESTNVTVTEMPLKRSAENSSLKVQTPRQMHARNISMDLEEWKRRNSEGVDDPDRQTVKRSPQEVDDQTDGKDPVQKDGQEV